MNYVLAMKPGRFMWKSLVNFLGSFTQNPHILVGKQNLNFQESAKGKRKK